MRHLLALAAERAHAAGVGHEDSGLAHDFVSHVVRGGLRVQRKRRGRIDVLGPLLLSVGAQLDG